MVSNHHNHLRVYVICVFKGIFPETPLMLHAKTCIPAIPQELCLFLNNGIFQIRLSSSIRGHITCNLHLIGGPWHLRLKTILAYKLVYIFNKRCVICTHTGIFPCMIFFLAHVHKCQHIIKGGGGVHKVGLSWIFTN